MKKPQHSTTTKATRVGIYPRSSPPQRHYRAKRKLFSLCSVYDNIIYRNAFRGNNFYTPTNDNYLLNKHYLSTLGESWLTDCLMQNYSRPTTFSLAHITSPRPVSRHTRAVLPNKSPARWMREKVLIFATMRRRTATKRRGYWICYFEKGKNNNDNRYRYSRTAACSIFRELYSRCPIIVSQTLTCNKNNKHQIQYYTK